jgi:3-oxoacyl-[acyl-carrier-protein] synthase-3
MLNADTTLTRRSLKDSFATLTLGSSASAIIMCDQELAEVKHPIVGGISLADTKHSALCTGGDEQSAGAGLLLKTRAADLMEAGTQVAKQTWEELKAELEWSNATPDLICTHQVTSRHRDGLYNDLGLDIAKDISTFPFLGNCGAASLPVTLSYAQQEGKLQSGDQVALMGIGSGINCSMFGLQW